MYVGSPESVAKKISNTVNTPGLNLVNLNCATPTDKPERLLRSIELYGTKVIPPVRDMLA